MCKHTTVAIIIIRKTHNFASSIKHYVHVVTIMVQTSLVFSIVEPTLVDPMEHVHSITLLLPCTLASMVSVCHQ